MTKLKVLAAVALCMAYIAGIVTGWAGYTLASEQPPPAEEKKGSWLSHTLHLTPEQEAQIEAIWSQEAPRHEGDDVRTRIRALYDERNARVRDMLTEEQKTAFDVIYAECEQKKDAISEERRARYDAAVQKTMAVLTPEQQEKYKEIIDDFEKRRPKRDRGPSEWRPGKSE